MSRKRLLTFRLNGEWMVYKVPKQRNREEFLPFHSLAQLFSKNELYARFRKKREKDFNTAIGSNNAKNETTNLPRSENRIEEGLIDAIRIDRQNIIKPKKPAHAKGYYTLQITDSNINAAAALSLAIAFITTFFEPVPENNNASRFDSAAGKATFVFFIVSAALYLFTIASSLRKNYAQDKMEGETRQFDALNDLEEKLPDIESEIQIKTNLLKRLKILIKNPNDPSSFNQKPDQPDTKFLEEFILCLEEHDDLNLFESIGETLKYIQAEEYPGIHKISLAIILQLMKDKLVDKFYESSRDDIFFKELSKITSISQLLKLAREHRGKVVDENEGKINMTTFLFRLLFNILEDKVRFMTIKRLALFFSGSDIVLFKEPVVYNFVKKNKVQNKKKRKVKRKEETNKTQEQKELIYDTPRYSSPNVELNSKKSLVKIAYDIISKSTIENNILVDTLELLVEQVNFIVEVKSQNITEQASTFSDRQPIGQVGRIGLEKLSDLDREIINLPEKLKFGTAHDNNDCFFDAFAQTLNYLLKTTKYNSKSLRMLCHEYYLKYQEQVNRWNENDYGNLDKGQDYYFIQYTQPELEADKNLKSRYAIWGRPAIEGRMICEMLRREGINIQFKFISQ